MTRTRWPALIPLFISLSAPVALADGEEPATDDEPPAAGAEAAAPGTEPAGADAAEPAPADGGSGADSGDLPGPTGGDVDEAGGDTIPEDFKKIGFGGVPAVNYNSDEGFGYGIIGRMYWYDYEKRDIQPYSKALTLRIFLTTKWIQSHLVELDALDVADLPLRVRARAVYYTTVVENFCGMDDDVACLKSDAEQAAAAYYPFIDSPDEYDQLSQSDQETWDTFVRRYYTQRYLEPYLWIDTRTKIKELPNKVEVMASWRGSYYVPGTWKDPTAYEGSRFEDYTTDPDLVATYPELNNDGFASVLQAGIMLDNRDFEPAPTRGYWLEASLRGSHRYIGSQWNYLGANLTLRGYLSLIPEGRLVLAERVILDGQWGDMPAAEMVRFGGSQIFTGWGGQYAGRGIRGQRYIGRIKASNQTELRLHLAGFDAGTQRFDFGLVGFGELGYVAVDWADISDDDKEPLLPGVGAGLRVAWNRNFIIRVDSGFSPIEDWGPRIYINLDHIF